MSPRSAIVIVGTAALMATGCGQTGALRLPADAPAREHYLIGNNPNAKPTSERPAEKPAEPSPVVPPEPAP